MTESLEVFSPHFGSTFPPTQFKTDAVENDWETGSITLPHYSHYMPAFSFTAMRRECSALHSTLDSHGLHVEMDSKDSLYCTTSTVRMDTAQTAHSSVKDFSKFK